MLINKNSQLFLCVIREFIMKTKFIKRIVAAGMAVACMVATTISAFALEGGSTWNENGYSVDMKVYADYLTGYAEADSNYTIEEMRLDGVVSNPYSHSYLYAYGENTYYISDSAKLQYGVDKVEANYYFYTSEGYEHSQYVNAGN